MTEPSGFYVHYKRPDRFYFVITVATNRTERPRSELVREVCYMALYDEPGVDRFHHRDLSEWNERVVLPDDALTVVPRFQKVDDPPAEIRSKAIKLFAEIVKAALL